MSWADARSYTFNIRDKRFRRAQRLFLTGTDEGAEKGLEILGELRRESASTLKLNRTRSRARKRS